MNIQQQTNEKHNTNLIACQKTTSHFFAITAQYYPHIAAVQQQHMAKHCFNQEA